MARHRFTLQGYLAHEKAPIPLGTPRTLGIGLRKGPKGMCFLVSEVPLYVWGIRPDRTTVHAQGYLADKKRSQ